MLELLDFQRIDEIVVLVVPGFVSLKVWMLINPTARLQLSNYVLDIIVYSVLNFAALAWLLAVSAESSLPIRIVAGLIVFVAAPTAWPLLLRAMLNSRFLRGRVVNPIPLAWDHVFGKGDACFVLVHLKNGDLIGGLYAGESFASSYPEPQEVYLSQVWCVDGQGRFKSQIEATKGVLVNRDVIEYLEFFDTGGSPHEEPERNASREPGEHLAD